MNYLQEIVVFHRWKEVNPLPASAIALWHELMAICNKAGWPEEFTYPNMVLQSNAGLSRKEFERARQLLIENGLINYRKSNRVNRAGKYKIISRLSKKGNERDNDKGNERDNDKGNERDNFIKELKDLNSSTSSSESIYQAHERVFGFVCNPIQIETLYAYVDDGMDQTVVIRSIERAGISSKKYNFSLITKILNDYAKSNVRTLEQAEQYDDAFEQQKESKSRKSRNDIALQLIKEAEERERIGDQEAVRNHPEFV